MQEYDYKDYKIRLCYSYTYNPKRAITDVGFYTATPRMESLQQNIVFNGGSYVVAENVLYSDVACLYANDSDSTRSEKYASKNPIGLVARNHSYVYPPSYHVMGISGGSGSGSIYRSLYPLTTTVAFLV